MDELQANLVEFLRQDDMPAFLAPLIRLVAAGEPVPVPRVAAEAGIDADRLDAWLRSQPGTDWDEHGRLLGFGLTQRPTKHEFLVDGRQLYAFCAADTLLFPPILGRPASVTSTCPVTGRTIHVEVTPDAVTSVDPPTSVVTQVTLRVGVEDIRGSTCDHGHYFATDAAAARWREEHPGGAVLPVDEFFTRGLAVCRDLGWVA